MLCSACESPVPVHARECPVCGTATPVHADVTNVVTQADDGTFIMETAELPATAVGGATGWSKATAPGSRAEEPEALSPGSVLGGRYEILRVLGEGGMGAVLQARDREVDRVVALKVIRSELVGSPDILRRFRQELVLARQVTHRNVVRIFDLGVSDGIRFITMEYIEGRELAALLEEKGKLAPEEAASIMLQVCHGLAAAHAEGVIHRDLKPQNIMLDTQGRAAVMDFGIANSVANANEPPQANEPVAPLEGPANLTRAGSLLGTPRYMSPEQAQRQTVDYRSDLFTVGLLLYECLTGKVPSGGKTLDQVLKHRSTVQVKPLAETDPSIPAALSRIVSKCLEIDPAKRYQSADEVVYDLELYLGIRHLLPKGISRTQAVAAGALVILLSVATAFGLFKLRNRPVASKPQVTVMVGDFTNSTGNPVFDGTIEPSINTALEGASFITAFNRGEAHKVAQQLFGSPLLSDKTARLVAAREGVGVVVSGGIAKDGGGYRVSATAIDAGNGKDLVSTSGRMRNPGDLPRVVGSISAAIRKALGDTTPKGAQIAAAETFSSKSLEASQQYARAQELQFSGKWNQALDAYHRSIQLDPDLGRAYAGLAATLANLGRTQDAAAMYRMAMSKVERMSDREKYRTRGGYYLLRRDYQKAIEQYKALVKQYPSDSAALTNLSLAYFYQRNMSAALEEGKRALRMNPDNLLVLNNLGLFAMYAGDFDTAVTESQRLLKLNPSFQKAYVCLGLSLLGLGKVAEAADAYRTLAGLGASGASDAATAQADLAWYQGRREDAIQALTQAVETDTAAKELDRAAVDWAGLAQLWLERKQTAKAVSAADHAVSGAGSGENILYPVALVYLQTGNEKKAAALAARLGQRFEAEPQAYGKLIQAETQMKHGEYREAVKTFLAARALADTWLGRFGLGKAYLKAQAFTEADTELDACLKRKGEAAAVFLDDEPTFHVLPEVYFYLGQAREGLQSPGAAESFRTYTAIRDKSADDPLLAYARKHAHL